MIGKVLNPKYDDLGSPIVTVQINKTVNHKTLINIGASINVMTRHTMLNLNLQSFMRHIATMLQLVDN